MFDKMIDGLQGYIHRRKEAAKEQLEVTRDGLKQAKDKLDKTKRFHEITVADGLAGEMDEDELKAREGPVLLQLKQDELAIKDLRRKIAGLEEQISPTEKGKSGQ